MANKTRIEFDGFEELTARLFELGGNLKETTDKALSKTKRHIHKKLGAAMQKHNQTYDTVKSLDHDSGVEWAGSIASMSVGFHIRKGGLPSIFLMYGTPKMPKDQALYNAVYGKKTRDEIKKMQEDIFYEEIRRIGG